MKHYFLALIAAVAMVAVYAAPAEAQNTRSWVSGTGNDVNPCSRTQPCLTFFTAHEKTGINGVINCLDPGGYGSVHITKSITIDCEDTQGSLLTANPNGISINIAPNGNDPRRSVRLRGLSIHGFSGTNGINITGNGAAKVFIEEVFIENFTTTGILWEAPGGDLVVKDSSITDIINGPAIRTRSTVAGQAGIVHVSIARTNTHNSQQGIRFEGNSFGVVSNSTASNNALNGFVVFPQSVGGAQMNIVDSTANNNKQFGVFAGGAGGQSGVVRIFNLTAYHNSTNQLNISAGGQILSNGRNHIGDPTHLPGVVTDR